MAQDKKRQHYVPKFYLKLFSLNNECTQIGLFNFRHDLFKAAVALEPQAQRSNFYGKDGIIENALSTIETESAPVIKNIIAANVIPAKMTAAYMKVYVFSILLAYRTTNDADAVNAIVNDYKNLFVEYDVDLTDEEKTRLKSYELVHESPAEVSVSIMIQKLPLGFDLKAKLILNKTDRKLIISDNPVIRYNQFLEQRKHHGGNDGIATKGLQIFVPISPNHLIIFYDEGIYKIGDRNSDVIEMTVNADVDFLNLLQLVNCNDQVYFNHEVSETYIRSLISKAKNNNTIDNGKMKLINSYTDKENNEHFWHHAGHNCISIDLKLSFIKQTKKAKLCLLSKDHVQIRASIPRERLPFNR